MLKTQGKRSGYLKILTPETTNGRDPVMTPEGKIKYKESHMHLLAEKRMRAKNAKLPVHLKHIIEVVYDEVEAPKPQPQPVQVQPKPKPVVPAPIDPEDKDEDEDDDEDLPEGEGIPGEFEGEPEEEEIKVARKRGRKKKI